MTRRNLADRFILRPDRTPVETNGKLRREVPFAGGVIELWGERTGSAPDDAAIFVLKFSGQCGRAERAGVHPADAWPQLATQVWGFNPPGYGGSRGPSTLRNLLAGARHVLEDLLQVAAGRPVLLTGNSLGSATALHLAREYPVAGLVLRNPPPLKQLVVQRHGWWNLYLPAMGVARLIPRELDSIVNAQHCTVPAVAISCGADRVVPPKFQRLVLDSYGGEMRIVHVAGGDHITPIPKAQHPEYQGYLQWLLSRATGG